MRVRSFVRIALGAVLGTAVATAHCAYQTAAVADGGTITGKVVFKGAVPTKTVLPTKDKETCGGPRKDPLVIVGPGGVVQDAVVRLKGVTKGKAWTKPAKNVRLSQKGCVFEPHVMVMASGALDIHNGDPVLHNTHGYYGKNTAFNVALPLLDAKVTRQLRRPGVVRIDCDAHGWMEAWIYVVDNPYYAVTDANGTFSIADVPPGKYTLEVWQEHVGSVELPVTVTAKGMVQVPTVELKK